MITKEERRQQIRAELTEEVKHPSSWYRSYESKNGLSKKGKFLQKNKKKGGAS